MRFQTTLALSGLAATALAKSSDFPECIQACLTKRPTSSFCSGSESGSALDFCTCQSYSGTLLIECMQACPESGRAAFAAAVIPESCQKTLFPGVQVDNSGSSGSDREASPTQSSESAEETVAEEVTNETEVENTTTLVVAPPATTLPPVITTPVLSAGAGAETSATSTDGEDASQTSDGAAAASESVDDDDSAAMGREIPGLLALGALAAMLL